MLVSSFLILWVLPTLITAIRSITVTEVLDDLSVRSYANKSVLLSDTVDGVIYVFLKPDVRSLLRKTVLVRNMRRCLSMLKVKKNTGSFKPAVVQSNSTITTAF